jgi:hypothetical protein
MCDGFCGELKMEIEGKALFPFLKRHHDNECVMTEEREKNSNQER